MIFPQVNDRCLLCSHKLDSSNNIDHYGDCNICFISYYHSCILFYAKLTDPTDWIEFIFGINYRGTVHNGSYGYMFDIDDCLSFKEIVDKANKILVFI